MKPSWSGPTWWMHTWSYPASAYSRIASTCCSGSGPQMISSATASSVTSSATDSKCLGSASSHASPLPIAEIGQIWCAVRRALLSAGGPRPAPADDVLIEVLAGADTEKEAALHHRGGRGRGLRDDRRVDADGRARHAGAELQLRGGLGHAADDAPHERTLALLVDPGMVVIGDQRECEAGLLRAGRVAHEVVRPEILVRYAARAEEAGLDRKSTRLNSSH